jgi:hypothetical protein
MEDGFREDAKHPSPFAEPGPVTTVRAPVGWPVRLVTAIIVVVSLVCLVVIPGFAVLSNADVGTKAGVIQAATSWWGAVLALIASIIAALAYRNSVHRPDLEIGAVNSLDVVALTLTNVGAASARGLVVRVRFDPPFEFNPQYLVPSWRREDFTGDGMYRTLTWYGDESAIVHPGFEFHVPPISFSTHDRGDVAVIATVTWACEGRLSKMKTYTFRFPSPRF